MMSSRHGFVTFVVAVCTVVAGSLAACSSASPGSPFTEDDAGSGEDSHVGVDTGVVKDAAAKDTGVEPDATNPENYAEAPSLLAIAPSSAQVLTVGPSLVVTGTNFARRTVIQLEGAVLPTTYVSSTELRTTIPSQRLTTTGQLRLSVGTSPPGGGASQELLFSVVNGLPVLTAISSPNPPVALIGAANTPMAVVGTDFVAQSTIVFDGLTLPTTFGSATGLSAVIPSAKLVKAGTFDVKVSSPAPGGGISKVISFTVANPTVQLTSITPSQLLAGSGQTALTLNGAGFVSGSTVTVNGQSVSSTFLNSTQLTATVPATFLAAVGNYPVVVTNPAPGGGVSVPQILNVVYPAPSVTSLTPGSASTGDAPTVVTVTGTGYYPASQITFNNAAAATTYVSPTQVKATLSAGQLASPGAISVRIVNPAPGGGTSAPMDFQVTNPVPQIATVVPSKPVFMGSSDTVVTVNGQRFLASSVVRVGGSPLLTTFVSSVQLTATVPQSAFSQVGTLSFTVTTPAPGGGTSNTVTLAVGCDTTGVDLQLAALVTPQSVQTNFTAANAATSQMYYEARACPATFAVAATAPFDPIIRPYRAVVVQNTTNAPATLAAWAACASTDDMYLTMYRRATVPVTVSEREVCAAYVSEGAGGAGAFTSPEANGSSFCPGLTKANNGGISLAVCEKAVVYGQPYSLTSQSYTPPKTIKVQLE